MKVYALELNGETEWVAANTAIHALKFYEESTGLGLSDFENDDSIYEVKTDKWDAILIADEDAPLTEDGQYQKKTLKEIMNEEDRDDPFLIATTVCS